MTSIYPRPSVFSNPDRDFTPEELSAILQKPDAELKDRDFLLIFQSPVCAGTYQECAYFIPVILKRLLAGRPDDDIESMVDYFLEWVDFFADRLKHDGLFDEIVMTLMNKTRTFLERFEKESREGSIFFEIFDRLNDGCSFDHSGDKLLKEALARPLCYENAAWFFFLLEWFYADLHQSSGLLRVLAADEPFKARACDVILKEVISRNDPVLIAYWEGVLTQCGVL